VIQKVLTAIVLGILSMAGLTLFPYFPVYWAACFAILCAVLSYFLFEVAIVAALLIFGVTLAYHSFPLFVLFFLVAALFIKLTHESQYYAEIILLLAAAPLLAKLTVGNFAFPLEFLIVFIAPIIMRGKKVGLVTGLACLWCGIIGVLARESMMGYIVIGPPDSDYAFFFMRTPPQEFYDFGWLFQRNNVAMLKEAWGIMTKLSMFMISRPFIFIQALGWAAITLFFGQCLMRDEKQYWLGGGVLTVCLMLGLHLGITLMLPLDIEFYWYPFVVTAIPAMAVCLLTVFISRHLERKRYQQYQPTDTLVDDIMQRERARRNEMSLEETLKVQSDLQEYIKKKFVEDVAVLDIDIAESVKMKSGQSPELVVRAFTEYWKRVDMVILRRRGRLMNRAGDGAIYAFGSADGAVMAFKEIHKEISKFNKKDNPLKEEFRVRAGIHSGEILQDTAGQGKDIFSDVIDIAAHLQKLGAPGSLLVSEKTYATLKKQKEFEAAGYSEKDGINYYQCSLG